MVANSDSTGHLKFLWKLLGMLVAAEKFAKSGAKLQQRLESFTSWTHCSFYCSAHSCQIWNVLAAVRFEFFFSMLKINVCFKVVIFEGSVSKITKSLKFVKLTV